MDRGASDLSALLKTFFLVIFCNVLLLKVFLKKENAFYMLRKLFLQYKRKPPNTHYYGGQKARTSSFTQRKHRSIVPVSSQASPGLQWLQSGGGGTLPTGNGPQFGQSPLASQGICSVSGETKNEKQQQTQEMWTELC